MVDPEIDIPFPQHFKVQTLHIQTLIASDRETCFQKGFMILARIQPPSIEHVIHHLTTLYIGVVDVGDFELASARRFELIDNVENVRGVHVDPDHSQVRGWVLWLFYDVFDPVAVSFRNAVFPRMIDFFQKDAGTFLLLFEGLDRRLDALLEDIVTEHDDHFVVTRELTGQAKGLGYTALSCLVCIVDSREPKVFTIADESKEVSCEFAARQDNDIVDSGFDEHLDRVVNHGSIVDREEMLVRDSCKRLEPCTQSAGKDNAFHSLSVE